MNLKRRNKRILIAYIVLIALYIWPVFWDIPTQFYKNIPIVLFWQLSGLFLVMLLTLFGYFTVFRYWKNDTDETP